MPKWDISWTPEGDILADSYNVYSRLKGDPDWTDEGSTTGTKMRLEMASSPQTKEIGIAIVVAGLEAPEDDWTVIEIRPNDTSDLDDPADITDLSAAQSGASVALTWSAVDAADLEEYEIRQGTSWANGIRVHTAPATSTSATFLWRYSSVQTYYIKAKTISGRYAVNDDSATVTIVAEAYEVTLETNDEHSGGFTGTKSDTEVSGGDLQPTALPASYSGWTDDYTTYTHPWWWKFIPGGTYLTGTKDAGLIVDEKIEVDLATSNGTITDDYVDWKGQLHPEFDDTVDTETAADLDASSVYGEIDESGNLVNGHNIGVEIDTAQDAVPTWDGWRPWVPGATYRFRQVRMRFTLNALWPFIFPKITTLVWRRRRQNRKDEQIVTVSVTGGTALTWDTPFTAAPVVVAGVIGTTGDYATVEYVTATSAAVRIFEPGGTEIGIGTVHIHALGV